ncbi:MAG TPA: hypothetical protein VF593_06675 [Chthoniobacteraceae bacterium]|jgi:hypothetical protein
MLRNSASAGAVIVEALAAAMIIGLFLAGLFEMNAFNVRTLRSGTETVAASLVLQERLDQVRNTTWANVGDATYLRTVLTTKAVSADALLDLTETLTVSAYPPPSPAVASAIVTRAASGTTTIVSSNSKLAEQATLRADITISWRGNGRRLARTRTLCTIIAEGGITR